MKERLDVLLVNRGLAPSREKAKTMIMEGNVFVNNNREDKAGSTFPDDCNIEIHGKTLQYVSRGGLKLEKAMKHFDITMDGKVCMDIGASTGGFTDCMLQNGAKKVYAVDVGYGQFAWKLRQDERVVCMEKTNIRYVTPKDIDDELDFASVDVSFISLTKVLGPARALLKDPKILILDDSTSAVDTATDAKIRKAFAEEIPNTTKLIIAQRISSVMNADRIIVLNNGVVDGFGSHEELMETNAIYREVYESQTQGSGDFDEGGAK